MDLRVRTIEILQIAGLTLLILFLSTGMFALCILFWAWVFATLAGVT